MPGSGDDQSLALSIGKNAYLIMRQIALPSLYLKSYNDGLQESKTNLQRIPILDMLCNGSRSQPSCLSVIHSICEIRDLKAYEILA